MSSFPRPFGPYKLLGVLGQGVAAQVYAAEDHRGRTVALKLLHEARTDDSEAIARFEHEAEIARAVNDPHVVRVLDAGILEGRRYLAMTYVPGWPLHRLFGALKKEGLDPAVEDRLALFAGAVRGVAALHGAVDPRTGAPVCILHRDLAPKNLLVGGDAVLRLIDFGIGRSVLNRMETRTNLLLGTPGYLSPEVVEGRAVDQRTDIYALGVVLFELLTLERFLPARGVEALLEATLTKRFVPPSRFNRSVNEGIDAVVERATARDPEHRFPTARSLLSALARVSPGRPDRVRMQEIIRLALGDPPSFSTTEVPVEPPPPEIEVGLTLVQRPPALPIEPDEGFGFTVTQEGASGRRRSAGWIAAGFVILALGAGGFVLGRTGGRAPDPPHPKIEEPSPMATQRVTVEPRITPAPLPDAEPAPAASRKRRRPVRAPKRVPLRVAPERKDDRSTLEAELRALTRRGARLRARAPEQSDAIDRILRDAALESLSADRARARSRLEALSAELDGLAR